MEKRLGGRGKLVCLDIIYVIIRHRFGHQSGLDQSSRKKSAAILRRIAARFFLAFSKIDGNREILIPNQENMLKKRCMSKIQKMFRHLSHDLDMKKYVSNILYPIWKYTHKGFPPTHPMPGPPQTGPRGGMGRGGVGGNPL